MTQDLTKMMQDMMGAFPMDTSAMQGAFRSQAQLAERLSRVALDAAEQSTEISSSWTKDTLAKLRDVTTVKDEPADYSKAVTELASAQAETTAETMARFAEVAKRLQMETVELMLAAGKEMAEDTAEQTRAAATRSQQVAQDMAARGQDVAAKSQEAVNKMAEQSRDAADAMASKGKAATDATAEQGRAAASTMAGKGKATAERTAGQARNTADATTAKGKAATADASVKVSEPTAAGNGTDAKRTGATAK